MAGGEASTKVIAPAPRYGPVPRPRGPAAIGPLGLLCLLLALLGAAERGAAAMVTNLVYPGTGPVMQQDLTVNVGDTVVWTNFYGGAIYIRSYDGEWGTPPVFGGSAFAFAFTNSGFYAYKTTPGPAGDVAGTVTVRGWTNAPPPVTLNAPSQGHIFPPYIAYRLLASVAEPGSTAMIQYFANTNLIGTVTNPPLGAFYWLPDPGLAEGPYNLVAKAIDRQGNVMSSPPVRVWVSNQYPLLWGPRVLPTGQFLFFFSGPIHDALQVSDSVTFKNSTGLGRTGAYGMYVDENPPRSSGSVRFYRIVWNP